MLVSDLYLSKRRCGHTEYMLRAAVNNPRVIIVAANEKQIKHLRDKYHDLLRKEPWYKHLWWFFAGREHPMIINIGQAQRYTQGMMMPIMCDNLTLIQDHQR